ncbi:MULTISPECIES: hypothetical protein [Pseudomonas]|uniref:hypothetical protein n=1 Tax=Pseudomonas TaxID=286 RepID=UPI000CD3AB4E|nr:hypothetical protein [Pseudomonas putida]POF93136.1 hypothetical protein BGP83_10690 [Pseudomonas putida]
MTISVEQALLEAESLLPKFDITVTPITDKGGRQRLLVAIKIKPGTLDSRGQELRDGSYRTQEDIPLHTNGVEKSDLIAAVENMKNYLRTNDLSNGWTNLF